MNILCQGFDFSRALRNMELIHYGLNQTRNQTKPKLCKPFAMNHTPTRYCLY